MEVLNILFSDVFDSLPFPMALFKKNGDVCMANHALIAETGTTADEMSAGKINLLNRLTDENYSVLEAAERAFLGKTTFLQRLVYPLVMFCRNDNRVVSKAYKSAIIFPIVNAEGDITASAVMLMKR